MRAKELWIAAAIIAVVGTTGPRVAAAASSPAAAAALADLGRLLSSTGLDPSAVAADERCRYTLSQDGFVQFIASPPGRPFGGPVSTPEATATGFLQEHAAAFGIEDAGGTFALRKLKSLPSRSFVKLDQTHADVPVFAGEVIVQLDAGGRVQCVVAALARDLAGVNPEPRLTAAEIVAIARRLATPTPANGDIEVSAPRRMIYAPALLAMPGAPRLVWECRVGSESRPEIAARLLIDAASGELAARFTLYYEALNRVIYDANGTTTEPGTLVRLEGQAASGIAEADNVYDYLGDTYNFYLTENGRDGVDNAGAALSATVRRCQTGQCPWPNAAWNGGRMRYGTGFAVDDVTGHELTHGVTESESGLLYQNATGAINESLSDIWGEFIDLGNGRGSDSPFVWWDIGEDLPGGRLRDMNDPPAKGHPDRTGSSLYLPPTTTPADSNDFGGVHSNSGVNNKLCFLLTDGQSFNGQTVTGMGMSRVVDLYYEAATNLLTSGSVWSSFYNALTQAAINLGWNTSERNNLYRACVAVEIANPPVTVFVDPAQACVPVGVPFCTGIVGAYPNLNFAKTVCAVGSIVSIQAGSYPENLLFDKIMELRATSGPVTIGTP